MDNTLPTPRITARIRWTSVLLYSLLLLFFFQLVSDFIETIYAFGLLGVDIPPEIVCVLLFFTPVLLLPFGRGLPERVVTGLAAAAAVLRAFEVILGPSGKMIASGLGVGCLLMLLPALLARIPPREEDAASLELGAALTAALAASILLRTLGSGTDLTLVQPILGWLLSAGLLALVVMNGQERAQEAQAQAEDPAPEDPDVLPAPAHLRWQDGNFWETAALCVGVMGTLLVLYFAFASPVVLARWSDVDYRLVVLLLAVALAAYFAAMAFGWLHYVSKKILLYGNLLFLLAGLAAILSSRAKLPFYSTSYPFAQPEMVLKNQIPLFLMILLSPVVLLDFARLVREIGARRPSPRALAAGFALGSLFFLLVTVAQVFTTVYDYIPVAGPWFRDRFWLAFFLAGLGMALPVILVGGRGPRLRSQMVRMKAPQVVAPVLRRYFLPGVLTLLILSMAWSVYAQPAPAAPVEDASTLRVLTYNIQQGYSADGKRNYDGQLEVISSLHPDIIGLQETDVARFSGGNADIVRTFAEKLGMYSYYGPRTTFGTFGIALLSRYPIENPSTTFLFSSGEQTAAIQAQVTVKGQTFNLLVTHLGNDGPLIQQREALGQMKDKTNIIMMGDFNFAPATEQYTATLQTLKDAWVLAGSTPEPGVAAKDMIDHIFVSPKMKVQSARYVNTPASDHPALLAEIVP